jgi:hypothetical protein
MTLKTGKGRPVSLLYRTSLEKYRKFWKTSWSMGLEKIKYARPNTVKCADIWHTQERFIKQNVAARYVNGGHAIVHGAYPGAIPPRSSFFEM